MPTCERFAGSWIIFWMKRTSDFQSRQVGWDLTSSMHAWVATTNRSYRAQIRLLERTLHTIEKIPEASFSGDDWLDRRAFLAMLRTELLNARDLQRWRNNPQIHCDAAVEAIFDLVIRHAENLEPVLPAIESRLAKLSDYLAAGAACVKNPVPSLEQAGAPLVRGRDAIS